jgi:hypothetical protein
MTGKDEKPAEYKEYKDKRPPKSSMQPPPKKLQKKNNSSHNVTKDKEMSKGSTVEKKKTAQNAIVGMPKPKK